MAMNVDPRNERSAERKSHFSPFSTPHSPRPRPSPLFSIRYSLFASLLPIPFPRFAIRYSLFAFVLIFGCAPAYHKYPCGCVGLCYAPPPPLPYTTYHACPTPIAACFLSHAPDDWSPPPVANEPPPEPLDAPPLPAPEENDGG